MAVPVGADEDAALAIVRERFDPGCAAVERIGEGEWSRCFAFTTSDERELVIRIGAHRVDFEKDRLAAELAAGDDRLPVPEVLGIGDDAVGSWCISTRAHGTPLEQLDAAGWERVLPALLAVLDALADVDVDRHPGFGPRDGQGDRVQGWRRALDAHPDDAALHRRGAAVLRDLAAGLDPPRGLLHADLTNRNVLVDGERITAVLDWGETQIGDPLHEIAGLDVWAPWYPAIAEIGVRERALAHMAERGADLTDTDERIRAGQLRILLDALAYSTLIGRRADIAAIRDRLRPLL